MRARLQARARPVALFALAAWATACASSGAAAPPRGTRPIEVAPARPAPPPAPAPEVGETVGERAPSPAPSVVTMLPALPGGGRFQRGIEGPPRPHLTPIRFRIAELPVAELPRALVSKQGDDLQPPKQTTSQAPRELVGRSVFVQMGPQVLFARDFFGKVGCGTQGSIRGAIDLDQDSFVEDARWVATRWEGVRLTPASRKAPAAWEYTVVDGWFDQHRCKAAYLRTSTATAKEIVPELVYGFRATCSECSEREVLVLIVNGAHSIVSSRSSVGDALASGQVGRAIVPVRRGTAESVVAAVDARKASTWARRLGATPLRFDGGPRELLVDIEISQAVAETEPLGTVYVGLVHRQGSAPGLRQPEPLLE